MKVGEFLAAVEDRLLRLLPPERRDAQSRIAFSFLQLHFGDPRLHFECWVQRQQQALEIGLHFEGHREFSYAWAAAFAERMPEVMARLGPQVELEEWTESWARLHEKHPAPVLDEALAGRAAERLAAYVTGLHPLLDELAPSLAGIPPPPARRVRRR